MCRELKNFKWIKKKERAKSVKVDECQNIINDFFAQTPRRHSKYEWELVRALFFCTRKLFFLVAWTDRGKLVLPI